ncbi:hypothetical protein [Nostoc sp.]
MSPSLLGFSANLEGRLSHSFTETVTVIEDGNLVAEWLLDGALALSPDLIPLPLELRPQFAVINGRNAVIRYLTISSLNATVLIFKEIEDQLKAHNTITNAFKISVTDYAREKWT